LNINFKEQFPLSTISFSPTPFYKAIQKKDAVAIGARDLYKNLVKV
jgi:hypothetical protein